MCPVYEPMTFEELSELYRVEKRSSPLSSVRPDLYRAMADLLSKIRQEYERLVAVDPDSIMAEGALSRKRNAEKTAKQITEFRVDKICMMAVHAAQGSKQAVELMTPEERDYYEKVTEESRKMLQTVDRLRGKGTYRVARIDEPMPGDVQPDTVVPQHIEDPPHVENTPYTPEVDPEPEAVEEPAHVEETVAAPATESTATPPDDQLPPDDEFEPPFESFDEPFDDQADDFQELADEPPKEPVAPAPVKAPEPEPARCVPIRILEDLPPFAGPRWDYVLKKEDVVVMPTELAQALVRSEKAQLIVPSP